MCVGCRPNREGGKWVSSQPTRARCRYKLGERRRKEKGEIGIRGETGRDGLRERTEMGQRMREGRRMRDWRRIREVGGWEGKRDGWSVGLGCACYDNNFHTPLYVNRASIHINT